MSNEIEVDVSGLHVAILVPCYSGTVPIEWATAFASTFSLLRKYGIRASFIYDAQCSLIQMSRNRLADKFLESDCNVAVWIDDDVIWKPEDLVKLVAYTKHYEMVCATYPSRTEEPTFFVGFPDEKKLEVNEHGLISVNACGFGFVAMRREVLAAMSMSAPRYKDGDKMIPQLFDVRLMDDRYVGEDIHFFYSFIYDHDGEVWLDPLIELKHVGKKAYDTKFKDALKVLYKIEFNEVNEVADV